MRKSPRPLLNLHEVLMESALDYPRDKDSPSMTDRVTQSFAMERSDKVLIDEYCNRHGTTPSAFYRACSRQLLRELEEV